MRLIGTALFMMLWLPRLASAEFETQTIFSKGAWLVQITYNTDENRFWCSANSTNGQQQTFSVTAYANRTLAIFFFDDRWDISPRNISFIIDVDYDRWTIDGSADGFSISSQLDDPEAAGGFIGDLMKGNAVALYNNDERRLATFSLNGSSAALNQLIDCWDKIMMPVDPFQTTQDPF